MFTDKRRAYLVTDGAQFDSRDGRVVGLEPKVLMFRDVRMAIAFYSGFVSPDSLCSAMAGICREPSQTAFLEAVMDLEAGLIHPVLDEHLPQAVSV